MAEQAQGAAPDLGLVPLFSGLNPGEKKRLQASAKFALVKAGEVFARQGEFTGSFHVILTGVVSAFRTEASGETRVLESLGPEKWFGEVSALSNQPALATLKAETPCLTVSIAPEVFKAFHSRANSDFRKRIDENYRERGLLIHLRTVPLFRSLDERELRALRTEVAFRSFAKDQVIAKRGEEAQAIFLVRSGAVKCVRTAADGAEEILGYYMTNSSFGERALSSADRTWRGDHVTMAPTDVLEVPGAVLKRLPPQALETLNRTLGAIEAEEQGQETGLYDAPTSAPKTLGSAEREIMVQKGSAKGGEALVIDLERCVRCNACVESCVAVHEDRVPRLSKKGSRVTFEDAPTHHRYNLATSCYNCQVPGCMLACTFGAIRRDVQGLIRFDYKNCVGCAMCVEACPYDVIRLTPPPGAASAEKSFWQSLPLIGKFFGSNEPAPAGPVLNAAGLPVQAKAVKCDLCAGLPFQACVYNCPTSAIKRESPERLMANKEVQSEGTFSFSRKEL
jgi:Fe-S-cluster-containing dehydrogenase component/CRP-like cAMP-binding protein